MQPTQLEDQLIPWYVWESILISTHPFLLRDVAADRYTFDCHFGGKWQRFPLSLFRLPRKAAALTFRAMRRVFVFFHH